MDPVELAGELEGRLEGGVHGDELQRELYATAACSYRERPLLVVEPKGRGDVVEAVEFAGEHGVPITGRGAGSSLAGQAVGPGMVMDFSVHMDSVLEVNPEEGWVEVEPGVVLADLNGELESHGLFFPPDPSSGDFCTLGGMLANNSSGPHSLTYGDTRDYALGVEAVLPDGSMVGTGELGDGLEREVRAVVEGNEELVEEWTPGVSKNCSGYFLKGFLETGDATEVLVGSEGTLGLFTRARLELEELPEARSTGLMFFESLGEAGEAVPRLREVGPSAIELMDDALLGITKDEVPEVEGMVPEGAEAALLVEFDGSPEEVSRGLEEGVEAVEGLCFEHREAESEGEREELWRVRSAGLPLLHGMGGDKRVTPFVEDAVVPPARLPEYVAELHRVFDDYGVEAVVYGHAGEGNVHTRPLLDLDDPGDRRKMREVANRVFSLVEELGGTISGEHGDGYVRTWYLKELYGPMYRLFEELKEAVDPEGLMNPEKVVGPDRFTDKLRRRRVEGAEGAVAGSIEACHGCGSCRSSVGRMCPFFDLVDREAGSTRARANAARAVAEGRIAREEAEEVFDLCFTCRSCVAECHTEVDGGLLAAENREASTGEKLMGAYGVLGSVGRRLPVGGVDPPDFVKSLIGMSTEREVPGFREGALRERLPREPEGEEPVALFAGCHSSFYDPGPALALAEVLERCGLDPYLPEQVCCGLPMYASGNAGWGERAVEKNRDSLPQGIPIVSTCPSCVTSLSRDYPERFEVEGLEVYGALEFLEGLRERGEFVEPEGEVEEVLAHHEPCNSKANGGSRAPALLDGVADTLEIEGSCCGMGGVFGHREERYEDSMEVGGPLFDELEAAGEEGASVVTECPSCSIQIGDAVGEETRHPVEVLAEAYREES